MRLKSSLSLFTHSYEIIKNKQIDVLVIASSFFNEIKDTLNENNIKAKEIETFF
ncbi:hypothetical protein ACKGJI_10960 [Sulfurospirillum sp. 1307]|jgi:hypothetical protein